MPLHEQHHKNREKQWGYKTWKDGTFLFHLKLNSIYLSCNSAKGNREGCLPGQQEKAAELGYLRR